MAITAGHSGLSAGRLMAPCRYQIVKLFCRDAYTNSVGLSLCRTLFPRAASTRDGRWLIHLCALCQTLLFIHSMCLVATALAAGAIVRGVLTFYDLSLPVADTVGALVLLAIAANARAHSFLVRMFGSAKA